MTSNGPLFAAVLGALGFFLSSCGLLPNWRRLAFQWSGW